MSSNVEETKVEEVEAQEEQKEPSLDELAYQFQTANKLARQKQRTMSSNGLNRVINAVREFPLHDPKFRNKSEEELHVLTLNAIAVKNRMMEIVMKEQQLNNTEEQSVENKENDNE